jgi:phage minor structural protein
LIYILNRQENVLGVLSNKAPFSCPYYKDKHRENIQTGVHTYEFSVPASHKMAENLVTENFVIITDLDQKQQMFKIKRVRETTGSQGYDKNIFCEHVAVSELLIDIVRPTTLASVTLENALLYVLDGTIYSLGEVDYEGVQDIVFEDHVTVLQAIHMIVEKFAAEIQYEVIFKNGVIEQRLVHVTRRRGTETNYLFTYGKNLLEVERTETSENLVTALIGVGKKDSEGNAVDLVGINRMDSRGYYVPQSTDYMINEEALQEYGKNGKHIFGVFQDNEATNQVMLFDSTADELEIRSRPQVEYRFKVLLLERYTGYEGEKVRVGDTILAKDTMMKPIRAINSRIIELVRSYTNPEDDELILGDYRPVKLSSYSSIEKLRQKIEDNEAIWNSNKYTVSISSSGGDVFKNGTGSTDLRALVYYANKETDTSGESFQYNWTKLDLNGEFVENIPGKQISVTAADITEKATYSVDVLQGEEILGSSQITITEIFDGETGPQGERGEGFRWNLLRNTGLQEGTEYHYPYKTVTVDDTFKNDGLNTWKFESVDYPSLAFWSQDPDPIPANPGEVFSASSEIYIPANHGLDNSVTMEIQFFDEAGSRIDLSSVSADQSIVDEWQRLTLEGIVAPANTVTANARMVLAQNGLFWGAKQKFEKGDSASEYAPHPDDLIGEDGQSLYTWVKYADDELGTGMTDTPDGKEYIGFAYNQTSPTESSDPADYDWALIKGETGSQGIAGPPGADGESLYTWLKYADTPTSGMSDNPTGKAYIGLSYNNTSATESTNYADYDWSLVKGEKGSQGVQGPPGEDGQSLYTWVKYADDSSGTGMTDLPDGKAYIGLSYNNTSPNESTLPEDYTWALVKGETGSQGIPGEPGEDGVTYYTWLKYADTPTSGMSDDPTDKEYMGLSYNNLSPTESTNYGDYTWSKIKGEKGDTGSQGIPGPAGADGQSLYTWIKYADDAAGSGMSDSPTGKQYLGLAYNKTTPTESTDPLDYTWSKIEGPQGVQGPNGETYYTWIKYADTPTSGMSDSPTGKEYLGISYNNSTPTESTNYSDYSWSYIKGSKGDKGDSGIVPGTGAPSNPTIGQLWLDESQTTPVLKKWNGASWVNEQMAIEFLDPNTNEKITLNGTYIDGNGVYTGIISWNQGFGGNLQLGDENGKRGELVILDGEGGVKARLGSDGNAGFNEISVDLLNDARNVVYKTSPAHPNYHQPSGYIDIYVDGLRGSDVTGTGHREYPYATIQYAIDSIPRYLDHSVTIFIFPMKYDENIVVSGFKGEGTLTIKMLAWDCTHIRDWCSGSSANTGNHWVEIECIDQGTGNNVCLNKPIITNGSNNTSYPLTRIVDGVKDTSIYADAGSGSDRYVQIEFGSVHDLRGINIWKYWSDGRSYYGIKTEVYQSGYGWRQIWDGDNWAGRYRESSVGHKRTAYINGQIIFSSCDKVSMHYLTFDARSSGSTPVYAYNTMYADWRDIYAFGNGGVSYVYYAYASYVRVHDCEGNNSATAVLCAAYGSRVDLFELAGGDSPRGVFVYSSAQVAGNNDIPYGNSYAISTSTGGTSSVTAWTESGYRGLKGIYTKYEDPEPPPPPPPQEVVKSWWANSAANWRPDYSGQWNGYDGYPSQGAWNGWGPYRGYWFFGDSVRSAVAGKTIKRIRVYVTRLNSGGYSSGQRTIIRAHGYSSRPSSTTEPTYYGSSYGEATLSWGEGAWITLPSAMHSYFSSGGCRGIMVYYGSADYVKLSTSAKIEITYEE